MTVWRTWKAWEPRWSSPPGRTSAPHFAQVDLEALEEEDAYRLFLRHASLRKGDREEEVLELVRQVEGHTTAVILLAAQKEADGFTTGSCWIG